MKIGNNHLGYFLSILFILSLSFQLRSQTSFLPSSISGLKLWVTGDSLHKNASHFVDTCYDLSGNNNNIIQPVSSFQPRVLNSILNGHKIIRFDGADDYLKFNEITDIRTVFWIVKEDSLATSNFRSLLGHTTLYEFVRAQNKEIWHTLSSSFVQSGITRLNSIQIDGTTNVLPLTYSILSLVTTGNTKADNFSNDRISDRIFQGDLAELIIYNQALTPLQVDTIETYLRKKYTPPVQLGTPVIAVCDTSITLNVGPYFSSVLWSNGSTAHSITINQMDTISVVATDVFGSVSRDTAILNVFRQPLTLYSLPDTLLCNGSIVWDPGLDPLDYNFLWSTGSTQSSIIVSNNSTVWVVASDTNGCLKSSDTANIVFDTYEQIVSLGNDTVLCSGNPIYLHGGNAQTISYLWNDGSTMDSLAVNNSGPYWVTVGNVNGCSKRDTINITIAGTAPTVNFSAGNVCFGSSIGFIDMSMPPGGNIITDWAWNFGNLTTSTNQNPIYIYPDSGSYNVTLSVTTDVGCSAQLTKPVKVYSLPFAEFSMSNSCKNSFTEFTDISTPTSLIQSWSWKFGDIPSGPSDSSFLQNPEHLFSDSGLFSIRLIVQNLYGCKDTNIKNLYVNPIPKANFGNSLACKSNIVNFSDSSVLPANTTLQSSYWNFGGSDTSLLLNPSHIFSSNVNYQVTHVITASNGCSDTTVKTIAVHPTPFAQFTAGNACASAFTQFNDISIISGASITDWKWTFSGSNTSFIQNPLHYFPNSGNNNIKLVVTSADGCKDSLTQTVVVHANPIVSFSLTPPDGVAPLNANFSSTGNGSSSLMWDFGDGNQSTLTNPSNTYLNIGTYTITLIGSNNFGCRDTAFNSLEVLPDIIDVAIFDINTSLQNDFLSISLTLINKGTVAVTSLDFYIQLNNGTYIKEAWTGLIPRGTVQTLNLSTSFFLEDIKHFICVSALQPNGINDAAPADNEMCKSLDGTAFEIYPVFPNPAENNLTIPLNLIQGQNIEIILFNSIGQKIKLIYSGEINEGLQLITTDISNINKGIYNLYISAGDETFIKRFVKK